MRRNIDEWQSEFDRSFRATLLAVRDDVEDVHRVEIEAVIRDDASLSSSLEAGIEAAREALINAVKHSVAEKISLFSELRVGQADIHIRDNGNGFTSDSDRLQVQRRLTRRVEAIGGIVNVDSENGEGTDIRITIGT